MFPSTHVSANLPLSFGVTNSVRQKDAAPLALTDILTLVSTIFLASKIQTIKWNTTETLAGQRP